VPDPTKEERSHGNVLRPPRADRRRRPGRGRRRGRGDRVRREYVVLQGFATISGGNTESVIITSTSATPARYQVKLRFPGEQGRNGRLHIKVQLMPKL
jgi:hypothetical protein